MLELAFIVLAHVAEELVHRMPDRRLRRLHMVLIVNQPEYVEYQLAAVFALDVGHQFVHIRVLFEHLLQYCQRLSSVEYAEQIGKELDVVRMEDIISEQKGKNQVQVGFFL